MPSTVGACWAAARSSSSVTRSARVAVGLARGEVLGEAYEGGEGFPAFADGSGAGRGLVGPAFAGEDGSHLGGQVDGVVEE